MLCEWAHVPGCYPNLTAKVKIHFKNQTLDFLILGYLKSSDGRGHIKVVLHRKSFIGFKNLIEAPGHVGHWVIVP